MYKKGFTLVELLIVIGLLGAIALIVIAAINPIEQANRARDTRFKADSGQLISAIDRYFVAVSQFPWQTVTPTLTTEESFGFVSAVDANVGLCDLTSGCTADGVLITNNELKKEFRSRDFVKSTSTAIDARIFIGKEDGASASVYSCFIPKANSTKQTAIDTATVWSLNADGTRGIGSCTAVDDIWVSTDIATSCFVCVPE
ncbi:MAG: prepilin-type N-terminal cleavage/methylation domain-containing protein [Patescibacteria group bacterium]